MSPLALPLALSAEAYAHRGRVIIAEGLLRKAAEHLHLRVKASEIADDPEAEITSMSELPSANCGPQSIQAMVAWKLGQLYSVMPKRESEAERWLHLGRDLWPYRPEDVQGAGCIEAQLGGAQSLTGQQSSQRPAVASLLLNRLFLSKQSC